MRCGAKLVMKIINALYPRRGSKYSIDDSRKQMFETLLDLKGDEIIVLYDAIVHNKKEL
tara:strand:+ start:566 stop:742 length:177 start_codon:yes stop_codon:yes gene_type:complete